MCWFNGSDEFEFKFEYESCGGVSGGETTPRSRTSGGNERCWSGEDAGDAVESFVDAAVGGNGKWGYGGGSV
jgi:hypothetical protein